MSEVQPQGDSHNSNTMTEGRKFAIGTAIALVALLLTALAFWRDLYEVSLGHEGSSSNSDSAAASTPTLGSISQSPQATTFATESSRTTTSATSGGQRSYVLEFGDRTHFDLDSRTASGDETQDSDLGLNFGRFFIDHAKVVAFADDTQVADPESCAKATKIKGDSAGDAVHLNQLNDGESVCVKSSKGRWNILMATKVESNASGLGAGDITFEVRY